METKLFIVPYFNEVFSGTEPRQDEVFRRFGIYLRPHLQGVLVAW